MRDLTAHQEQLARLKKMFAADDLHPDLVPYVEDADGNALPWSTLRHPLVFQIPYIPTMNRLCNEQYRQKREQIRRAMGESNYDHVIWLHERPYRPDALWDLAQRFADPEAWLRTYPGLVLRVWTDTEFPHQSSDRWRKIFAAFTDHSEGRIVLADEEDCEFVARFNDGPVTVYRGHHSHAGRRGFSYSLDWEVAEFFARRFAKNHTPEVSRFTVQGSDIIGYSNARSEREIIVLPEHANHTYTMKL